MVSWAVSGPDKTVFDPSFGGGVFLSAALIRLEALGAENASGCLFGTDWDRKALWTAHRIFDSQAIRDQLRQADFLTMCPSEIGGPFDVVAGNPPYVRPRVLSDAAMR